MAMREQFDDLVVVKIGSSTLTDRTGAVDEAFISDLCEQISELHAEGRQVVVVTSGAAAAGRERLGFTKRPDDIPSLQACAAAGQAALTEVYAKQLAERGIACGQVLLTRRDVVDREGYLNARNTLDRLLDLGAVPVVNENDTVSIAEFTFGDNDMLGAIVSALVGASLYVILSDVDGLYTADPGTHEDAELIRQVTAVDRRVSDMAGGAGSSVGTGGMASKIRAARAMLAAGIPLVICHGRRQHVVVDAVHGEEVGTRFWNAEAPGHGSGRKLWIGLAEVPHGIVQVDKGAARAILADGASLLPVGVRTTSGSYEEGEVVSIVDEDGTEIARGVTRYSSEDMVRVRGLKLDVIGRFLPEKEGQPAVHRDDMLVF
ncbi:MAG: glutamate 5-kinase [Atopobiaceae bacterium]|jgi:glutamate 5-kinase|nr:glutamate 5-kinase [Atopobiaceae bacterium]